MKREVLRSLRVLACAGPLLAGTAPVLAAQESESYGAKSPRMARTLSFLGTAVPIVTGGAAGFAGGLVLGPLLGYMYSGDTGYGIKQMGVRAAVLGATVGAIGILGLSSPDQLGLGVTLLLAGGVATTVLAVRDIFQVGDRVRARNQRLAAFTMRPTYFPDSRSAGLLVTWRR